MAKITNEKLFKETPCTCFPINSEKGYTAKNLLCYSEGAVGVLSNRQDRMCEELVILPTPPDLEFHFQKFAKAGDLLHDCMKENNQDDFYACIEKQAHKRGISIPKPKKSKPTSSRKTKKTTGISGKAKYKDGKLVLPKGKK